MITQFLSLPRMLLVGILLGGGTLLVVFLNPPYTVCDSQIEVFKASQIGFLYVNPKDKMIKTTQYELLTERCKQTNSPGGCYELFLKLKQLLNDLDRVPRECASDVTGLAEVQKALWKQMKLMVELAWGSKPPGSFNEKLGWLDPADLALYCRLKRSLEEFYGIEEFTGFRERMFKDLAGVAGIQRNQAWEMMLLSTNCSKYL